VEDPKPFSPLIPAAILDGTKDLHDSQITEYLGISWDQSGIAGGTWSIEHTDGLARLRIFDSNLWNFFPYQYDPNNSVLNGFWKFSGIVENSRVPEAGTLASLIVSLIALVTFRKHT
jgi:hypothetical protein